MKKLIILFIFLISANLLANDYQVNQLKAELTEGQFEATTYLPLKAKVKAIIVLTPTIAGVSILEKTLAKYFSKEGFLVIIPLPYDGEVENLKPDVVKLDDDFLKPAIAAEKFITMVEEKFNLPTNLPVFALGASQGGIRSLIIASHSPRITAAWFATAGGDFASIYAKSKVKTISEFKVKHMNFLGITNDLVYEEYLRDNLKNDPAIACRNIKVPFVQVMTLKDDKVPTANQKILIDNCPKHKVITIDNGHIVGSLSTLKWKKQIKDFFLQQITKK